MKLCRKVLFVSFCLAFLSSVVAQQPNGPMRPHEVDPGGYLRLPSEVISHGNNERPVGKFGLTTYRLERVKLERPLQLARGALIKNVYHLIITGGPFLGAYTIWMDDVALPTFTFDDKHLVAQFLGSTIKLPDGALLSVSDRSCPTTSESVETGTASETVLPERLSVPPELRAEPPSERIELRTFTKKGQQFVGITVATDMADPFRNASLYMQIGRRVFRAASGLDQHGFSAKTASTSVPIDTFWKIPDGAQVIVKWGACAPGGHVVGRLRKDTLDQ